MTNETTSKLPTHDVCFVKPNKDPNKKGFWSKIGAAWLHPDAKGMNLELDFLPTKMGKNDGHIVIRIREDKTQDDQAQAA